MKFSFASIVVVARTGIVAIALACLASCGGGNGGPPPSTLSISNLQFSPNSIVVGSANATISGTLDFSGANTGLASLDLSIAGGGTQSFPIQGAGGATSGTLSGQFQVNATTVGHYTFDIWLVDGQGRQSNHLSGAFDVVINDLASSWTTIVSGVSVWLHRVIWTGTQFVAVGASGTILVSSDGSTWTTEHSGTANNLMGVAWSGNRLVAVGDQGTLVTSTDGTTWMASTLPVTLSTGLTAVAWSGTVFVAVGYDSNVGSPPAIAAVMLVSSDGLNWTVGSSGQPYGLYSVIWNGSQFVAGGFVANQSNATPAVLRSTDGQSWSVDTMNVGSIPRVIYDIASAGSASNSTMVAVGVGTTLTAAAGAPWQPTGAGVVNANGVGWSGVHFLACSSICALSSDGLSWSGSTSLPVGAVISSLVWGGPGYGRWIAVGYNGMIFASP